MNLSRKAGHQRDRPKGHFAMSYRDDKLDMLLRYHRTLTPEQREDMTRRVIERAKAYRAAAIKDLFRALFGWIRQRAAVARLQALDDRMLKDMGLFRSEIEAAVRGQEPARRRAGKAA
jgi:uncharacterized protein YjiS (DUF1127 family)